MSYTQNWPHKPLIDNKPTADAVIWSILSFVLLLAGIGGMIWYFGAMPRSDETDAEAPHRDPLLGYRPTPSQKATLKYFYVPVVLLLLQIGLGIAGPGFRERSWEFLEDYGDRLQALSRRKGKPGLWSSALAACSKRCR